MSKSKIKCTYEKCFRYFENEQAMIVHKIREPNHSYCKLCNVDCEDDMYYFIHQLASPAHNCCPVCAVEFKSISARDSHVSSQHRRGASVICAGCQTKFGSGNALMRHIEQDECQVISVQDFQMQRAERQIQKDAWEAEVDPFGIASSTRNTQSVTNTINGTDLVEKNLAAASGALGQSQVSYNVPGQPSVHGGMASSNLIDLNSSVHAMAKLNINGQNWDSEQKNMPLPAANSGNPRIKGWLNQVNGTVEPLPDDTSQVASIYDKRQTSSDLSSSIIAPSTHVEPNQTAPHQHIIRMPAHSIVSTVHLDIERYWDPVEQQYACPTAKCRSQFRTAEDFRKHLLSASHIGGSVTCPTCLKRFATTSAWVAHTESSSKRCQIRNSYNYNHVMREITGGVLGTEGFTDSGSVKFVAPQIDQWNEDE